MEQGSGNVDLSGEQEGTKIELGIRPVGKQAFTVNVSLEDTLSDVRTMVAKRLDGGGSGHVRLLHAGRQLTRGTVGETGLKDGETLTVLYSAAGAVDAVRSLREDVLLRGLEDGRKVRYIGAPRVSSRAPSLFGEVRALEGLEGREEAERILKELATHPGFYAAMAKRGWSVGVLAEMYPEGRVGVDPVCVLGYNVNKGQEIRLRLRTDDLAGFRPMHRIRQVLAHELAHIVHSEHDEKFKQLMLQIEEEAEYGDWRLSKGRVLGSGDVLQIMEAGSRSMAARARLPPSPPRRAVNAAASRLVKEAEHAMSTRQTAVHNADVANNVRPVGEVISAAPPPGDVKQPVVDGSGTTADVSVTAEAQAATSSAKSTRGSAELATLEGMGVGRGMARLALRETGGDASRAAEWVFSNMDRRNEKNEGENGDVDRLVALVNELRTEAGGSFAETLDTLHMYLSNVVRDGGNDRYRTINGENGNFVRRVGRYRAASAVLASGGFRSEGQYWRYGGDVGRAWVAKSVIEGQLIEELQAE